MKDNDSEDWELIPQEPDSRLPEEMRESLLKNATQARSHTTEEMEKIYDWANRVLIAVTLLAAFQKGELVVHVANGKVKFSPAGPLDPQSILHN
jgi:hypothetical protein